MNIRYRVSSWFCTIAAFSVLQFSALAQTPGQVKVIYPDGTVRFEKPQAAPQPTPETNSRSSTSGVSCCSGSSNGGPCTPECKVGKNAPVVEPVNSAECPNSEECKPIDVPIDLNIPTETTTEHFYVDCKEDAAHVPVPVIVQKTTEVCKFKQVEYTVKCCKIKVCIPCERCEKKTTKCEVRVSTEKQKIKVCKRRDGTYDVEVLDVPGMPKRWLLYMAEADKAKIEADLGITIPI